jgi:hypothetical protein
MKRRITPFVIKKLLELPYETGVMPPEYTQKERNQVYDKLRALLDSKDNELDEDSRLGNNEQEGEQEGGTEGSEKGEDEDRLGEQEAGIEGSEKGEDEDRRLGKFRFE